MRVTHKPISALLLLLYAVVTTAGAGHGSWSHCDDTHDHGHDHIHESSSCDHGHADTHAAEQLVSSDSHACRLCDWLGQAQSDDAAYPLLFAETLTIFSVAISSPVLSRDRGRDALPRGPPTLS
ncbi:MAG: hypothetical protein H8E66_25960 [Planctomycetes bacterium]|nr:hypothetical protein [Planctomycetota bacterium]